MNEVVLGPISAFDAFPAEVEVGRTPYYLVKTKEGEYKLLCRICPHAGYLVEAEGEEFYCYAHGWSFDGESGKCQNAWGGLEAHEVEVRDDQLIVKM